ncbi:RNA-directed DNA polymerase [Cupriavidus pauculus]|nr:RNA-dependent DNA polymerase [Cupriavidus pauculus]UAL00521.1 RNA-directed DNA polymerase [Cupriavidus pauculus]
MTASEVFKREFSRDNLLIIYREHIAETSAIGIDRLGRNQFERDLDRHIDVIYRKARDGSYRFSQYKEKLISKGAKKPPRVISIPTFRDRVVLRALCNVLRAVFETDVSQKIPQAVIFGIKGAIESGEYSHFAKLDIKEFYPSIQHHLLLTRLRRRMRKKDLLDLISAALETPTVPHPTRTANPASSGVPQGLSISNILAEVYLSAFDGRYASRPEIRYFRYVDDVLLLAKGDASHLVEEMRVDLQKNHGLSAHELSSAGGKTICGEISEDFSFLGYQFRNGRCLAKSESVKRLEDSLADIFTTYKYKVAGIMAQPLDQQGRDLKLRVARNILLWRLNLRITGCIFEGARKGWIFYFSQIDESNLDQLWRLDQTVKNLLKRFHLPADVTVKTFVRTYFEAKRRGVSDMRYIPNFDTTSIDEQRRILSQYFGVLNLEYWSDADVAREFAVRIRRATRELEHDIQDIS